MPVTFLSSSRNPPAVAHRCLSSAETAVRDSRLRGSALDDVHREATPGGLLVLVLHVGAGLLHGLDDLVEGDVVAAVAAQGHASGGDGLDGGHAVAFDARDLHE